MAVKKTDQEAGQTVSEPGLRKHRSRLGLAEDARADDEVGAAADGVEEARHFVGMVRVVAVEEDDDVGRRGLERREPARHALP